MAEQKPKALIDEEREELLSRFVEKMFSLMKQIHRDIEPQAPLLSPPQARLAFTIAKYKEEGISVKDLARIADITPGAITQFTDVLIAKNLVTREEDPSDRRIVRLKITQSAKIQMETFRKAFLTAASRKLAVLDTNDLKHLNNILDKVDPAPFEKDDV
jgi:DNA-binding MarR family transcriptional regulator